MANVSFLQLPEDEAELTEYLLRSGDLLAWSGWPQSDPRNLGPFALRDVMAWPDPVIAHFGLAMHAAQVAPYLVEIEGKLQNIVDYITVPVLSYSGVKLRGNELYQSVFNAEWRYYGEAPDATLYDKPAEFVRWGKRVFNWVRRFSSHSVTIRGFPARATRRVFDAVEAGTLTVGW